MKKPNLQVRLFVFALLFLSACASTPPQPQCENLDWFEMGRRHGIQGEKFNYLSQAQSCQGDHSIETGHSDYKSGYQSGKAQHCSPTSGWNLGRLGQDYSNVCSEPQFSGFIKNYNLGKKVAQLEKERLQVLRDINKLSLALDQNQIDPKEKKKVLTEISLLRKVEKGIANQMDKIEDSKNQLPPL